MEPPDAGLSVPEDWAAVSRRIEAFVRGFFRGRPEIDCDDVTQDVCLELLRSASRGTAPGADLEALGVVIARRRCIDALRRVYAAGRVFERRDKPPDAPAHNAAGVDAMDPENSEVHALFLRVRGHLSARCRTVLDQLLLGLQLAEVAASLGLTAGAVRNRWFYCRRQIMSVFAEWGIQADDFRG